VVVVATGLVIEVDVVREVVVEMIALLVVDPAVVVGRGAEPVISP